MTPDKPQPAVIFWTPWTVNRKPFEMDMSVEFTTDNLLVKGYQRYVPTYYDWRSTWATVPTA